MIAPQSFKDARAQGESRTLSFHHTHRDDNLTVTFKRNGRYDDEALKKLNYYLRDWRNDDQIRMDPQLFDILWEVYREVGGKEPIHIISSYRSPQTNAMLHRRSRGVARFSQHMLGKAIDFFIPGVSLDELRAAGLRQQHGGVGFYPTSGSPFVHLDTGSVRHWPRMTHDQLARVFPDGRTVHVPSDGQPLRNYALAQADLERRGGSASSAATSERPKRGIIARMLGIGRDDEEENEAPAAAAPKARPTLTAQITTQPGGQPLAVVPMPPVRPPRPGEFGLASAASTPVSPPAASGSASDIINSRGVWQGDGTFGRVEPTPRMAATAAAASVPAASPAPGAIATAPTATPAQPAAPGAIAPNGQRFAWLSGLQGREAVAPMPRPRPAAANAAVAANEPAPSMPRWPGAAPIDRDDQVPTDLALAYAANAGPDPAPAAALPAARPAAPVAAAVLPAKAGMTVAVKGPPARARPGQRNDDPWLRGIVMAASMHYSMNVAVFGAPDAVSLRAFMRKPSAPLAMTFSDDPTPGLTADEFSGSAVSFLPTVSFIARTAGLY